MAVFRLLFYGLTQHSVHYVETSLCHSLASIVLYRLLKLGQIFEVMCNVYFFCCAIHVANLKKENVYFHIGN